MDFSGIPILVLGDVMLDHYIVGDAERVSPEAPVPVVSKRKSWAVPGGAANVARGLARLGCEARLLGLAGKDAAGETLRQEAAAEGVVCGLIQSQSRPTSCKTRIMAHGQQLLRVDEEIIQPPSFEEMVSLRVSIDKMLHGCKALILSDYAKGALLRDRDGASICGEAIRMARAAKIPVIVDPKGVDWERYSGSQCVTPNTAEFKKIGESLGAINGFRLEDEARLRNRLADAIRAKYNIERLLLTRGAKGMNLYAPDSRPCRIAATMREVADVSGAGDTVIATLAACVASNMDWEESARIANIAAGIAVGKIGTAPVSIGELNHALRERADNPRLFTMPDLLEKVEEWRRQGQKIVFTNGCFDLVHPGHISLLRQAAQFGDRLIVGLNSDASVARLKGPGRPIQDEQSRAKVIAALRPVDAVALFEEDTPENLIRAIKPDCLVKGNDYRIGDIAGAPFVQANGGQVRLVEIVDGQSTSELARRARGGNP